MTGDWQLSACATERAASRLPMPDGPASTRLGGSVFAATERDSSSIRRAWPTTSRKGTIAACYHAVGDGLRRRRLLSIASIGLLVTLTATEESSPEAWLLVRCRRRSRHRREA